MADDDPVISWGLVGSSSIVTGAVAMAASYPVSCTQDNIFTGEAGACQNVLGMTPFVLDQAGSLAVGVALGLVVGLVVAAYQWFTTGGNAQPSP